MQQARLKRNFSISESTDYLGVKLRWFDEHIRPRVTTIRCGICNDEAQSVIESMRERHKTHVFVWRRERVKNVHEAPAMPYRPVKLMNNTAWQNARQHAGLRDLHCYDLRHTVGMRLTVGDLLNAFDAYADKHAFAPQPAQVQVDTSKVICPSCVHQFRAIPQDVQRLMLDAGFEPPFTAQPAQRDSRDAIIEAAKNLVAMNGRHNTEIAYNRLAAAIAAAPKA